MSKHNSETTAEEENGTLIHTDLTIHNKAMAANTVQ